MIKHHYPVVIQHGNWNSTKTDDFPGISYKNGWFAIAILDYQNVPIMSWLVTDCLPGAVPFLDMVKPDAAEAVVNPWLGIDVGWGPPGADLSNNKNGWSNGG